MYTLLYFSLISSSHILHTLFIIIYTTVHIRYRYIYVNIYMYKIPTLITHENGKTVIYSL